MKNKTEYVKSLLGRTFMIATPSSILDWQGYNDEQDYPNDYESLEDFMVYDSGYLSLFKKNDEDKCYLYYSMNQKIEIFRVPNGIIVHDGFLFNESFDYSKDLNYKILGEAQHEIHLDEEQLVVFDCAMAGKYTLSLTDSSVDFDGVAKVSIEKGSYLVYQVEVSIDMDDGVEVLMGVIITKNQ